MLHTLGLLDGHEKGKGPRESYAQKDREAYIYLSSSPDETRFGISVRDHRVASNLLLRSVTCAHTYIRGASAFDIDVYIPAPYEMIDGEEEEMPRG